MNFAPLMVFSVVTPALVNNSQESAPDPRCLLSWKFTNVVFDHVMTVVVVLVAADREVRNQAFRQAAAVGLFFRRYGVADVVGFAHEQRINHQ